MTEDAPQNLRRVVVRGTTIVGLGYFLGQALNLAAYLAIARLITPAEYGTFAAGALVTGVGMQLSGSGIQAALIQRRDRLEEAASTSLLSALAAGCALAIIAVATAPLVGLFFRNGEAGAIAAALAGWAVLRCAAIVPDSLMQRRFSFMRRLVVDPSGIAIFGVVSIVAVANGMGPWGLVVGTYASAAVRLLLSWILARWRPSLRLVSYGMWLEITRFARHVAVSEGIRRFTNELPAAVVGRYLGAGLLGQYRYGERLGTQPQAAMTNVVAYVLLPAFARIAHDEQRLRRAFLRSLRWTSVIAVPAGLILLPLGPLLATVLLGEQWQEAGYAMMGLCAYVGARSVVQIATEIFKVGGRPDLLTRMHALSAVATAVCVLGLMDFGIAGIAAGVSISSVIVSCYATAACSRLIDVRIRQIVGEVWAPIVAALTMAGIVAAVDHLLLDTASHDVLPSFARLAVAGLIGILVYVGVLQVIAPATGEELRGAVRAAVRHFGRSRPRHAS